MDITKARQLKDTDLNKEIDKVRQNIVKIRSDISMNQIKNYTSLSSAKKYLARLLTIKKEKAIISQNQDNQNE